MQLRWIGLTTLFLLVASLQLSGCRGTPPEVRRSEFLLDTVVTITAYGSEAEEAVVAALAEVRRVGGLLDANDPDSEIAAINSKAGFEPVPVGDELFELLERCQYYSALSAGAFDITVRPLVELWAIGTERESVPTAEKIKQALELVGYGKMVLDRQTQSVFLPEVGMGIDLGGVGKGYAADQAREVLREYGIDSALIDAGGNIWTLGLRPDGKMWRIGIRHPRPEGKWKAVAVLPSRDLTIVTSGDYERYFIRDGMRYHHIFDPQTGYPAQELLSATIIGESSTEADILSTAVFVLGADRGMAVVKQLPNLTSLIVTPELHVHAAGPYKNRLELVGKEGTNR
ncbi:MAG TPA: FAD:protein FMN transferase [bacterium]|nr:FAD:protein FMN transferase [bacterium]